MYLRARPRKLLAPAALAALLALAGCGGGGGGSAVRGRMVRGDGYGFAAPVDWEVSRAGRQLTARPGPASEQLVQVSVYRLLKPFQASRWQAVVEELDARAAEVAAQLSGSVESSSSVTIGGLRAREYKIRFTREGRDLTYRLAFALRRRTEFQLLCRWPASEGEPQACGLLLESFRPT